MTNFFQSISTKISTLFAAGIVAISSIFPWRTTNTNMPIVTSVATPSATVSESASPSPSITPAPAPKVKTKLEITPALEPAPVPEPVPALTPQPPQVQSPQIYRILTLSELVNMNGANSQLVSAAYEAYNQFIQIPNLQYKTPAQQQEIFVPLVTALIEKIVDQQKTEVQNKIDALNQEMQDYNNTVEKYNSCLNNKVSSINSNPYLSESIRLARIEKAKRDCAN